MFKDNVRAYWHLLKGVLIVLRVMAFEKFNALFFLFYLLSALSISLVLAMLHWGAGIVFIVLSLVGFMKVLHSVQFLKRSLIRKGDKIEYADPSEDDDKKMFKRAVVILKMRFDEALKTKLIAEELMEDNRHFYLVKVEDDVSVVAYDWIIGISTDILDIEFEHEDLL